MRQSGAYRADAAKFEIWLVLSNFKGENSMKSTLFVDEKSLIR